MKKKNSEIVIIIIITIITIIRDTDGAITITKAIMVAMAQITAELPITPIIIIIITHIVSLARTTHPVITTI